MPTEQVSLSPRPNIVETLEKFLQLKALSHQDDQAKALLWRCAAEGRHVQPFGPLSANEVRQAIGNFDEKREAQSLGSLNEEKPQGSSTSAAVTREEKAMGKKPSKPKREVTTRSSEGAWGLLVEALRKEAKKVTAFAVAPR